MALISNLNLMRIILYDVRVRHHVEFSSKTVHKLSPMYFTNITGGEPFIRTDLKDIVRELYKKSERIVISTNGYQFGYHTLKTMRKMGVKCQFRHGLCRTKTQLQME